MSHVPYFLQSTTKLGTRPGRSKSKNLREAGVGWLTLVRSPLKKVERGHLVQGHLERHSEKISKGRQKKKNLREETGHKWLSNLLASDSEESQKLFERFQKAYLAHLQ